MSVREATAADLDAITAISIAAFVPADPIFPYRYPKWQQYPEDHYKYTFQFYERLLVQDNSRLLVFESPSLDDPTTVTPIAVSFWEFAPWKADTITDEERLERAQDLQLRRDANPARVQASSTAIIQAKSDLFTKRYGAKWYYLGILACHPAYQRRGAGRALAQWGIDKAKEIGWPVTLFAAPLGRPLYTKLGFQTVGDLHIQIEGESEFVRMPAMALESNHIA